MERELAGQPPIKSESRHKEKINEDQQELSRARGCFHRLDGRHNGPCERGSRNRLIAFRRAAGSGQLGQKGSRKARLQGIELVQGQWRRIQEGVWQELLQGKGRLRHRRLQAANQLTSPPGGLSPALRRSLFLKHMPANRFNGFTDYGI